MSKPGRAAALLIKEPAIYGPADTADMDHEFVTVKTSRVVTEPALAIAVHLKPPTPCSSFLVSESEIENANTPELLDSVLSDIAKHASELRWNCIETMLRADMEHKRMDVSRMCDLLVGNLDPEACEALAMRLIAHVERLGK